MVELRLRICFVGWSCRHVFSLETFPWTGLFEEIRGGLLTSPDRASSAEAYWLVLSSRLLEFLQLCVVEWGGLLCTNDLRSDYALDHLVKLVGTETP
jgi:hypothetical protein